MLWGFTCGENCADIALLAGAFAISTIVTTGIVGWFLVGIRPDYFTSQDRGLTRRIASPVTRTFYHAGKNLLGLLLIAVGVVLSLPGVPGQGLLTILVGVLLLDIPGKRRFELAIVRRRSVLRNINRLRARFKRAPLEVDGAEEPSEAKAGDSER